VNSRHRLMLLVAAFLAVVSIPAASPASGRPRAKGLHVSGNRLVNASGHAVRLHGVDRSGTEYACEQNLGMTDGPSGSPEFGPMTSWKINSVFIGLNEDCWLAINGVPTRYAGRNYINFVKSEVVSAERHGMYPVIGFFWGASGRTLATGQPPMPDNDHTPLFWEEVANTFKGDRNVMLRLQEEPHPAGNSSGLSAWRCWSQGDVQYNPSSDRRPPAPPTPVAHRSHCSEGFATVGFQSLINIVRGTGARNVIQVPGVQYANMMACGPGTSPSRCGFLDSADGVRVHDTLRPAQLMADVDVYPDSNPCGSVSCYNATYGPVIAQMPLEAGESGPGNTTASVDRFLSWMDGRRSGYFAWAWDTWAGLISDYNGTPKRPWGADYRAHIAR
jgi:endoglucanase